MSYLPFVAIARDRGCHVACALIGTHYNTLLALRRVATGCIAATRSAVAPRYTPSRGKIVPRK